MSAMKGDRKVYSGVFAESVSECVSECVHLSECVRK